MRNRTFSKSSMPWKAVLQNNICSDYEICTTWSRNLCSQEGWPDRTVAEGFLPGSLGEALQASGPWFVTVDTTAGTRIRKREKQTMNVESRAPEPNVGLLLSPQEYGSLLQRLPVLDFGSPFIRLVLILEFPANPQEASRIQSVYREIVMVFLVSVRVEVANFLRNIYRE